LRTVCGAQSLDIKAISLCKKAFFPDLETAVQACLSPTAMDLKVTPFKFIHFRQAEALMNFPFVHDEKLKN